MYEIVTKKELAPKIKLFEVLAPEMAEKAHPGQFIILIINECGERVPLTIAGYDAKKGTVAFVFNEVGKTTKQLGLLEEETASGTLLVLWVFRLRLGTLAGFCVLRVV